MKVVIDLLENRVNAVSTLVQRLRQEIARLEHELAERPPLPSPPATSPAVAADEPLLAEISRLRAERAAARERIRGLIKEIDQVSW